MGGQPGKRARPPADPLPQFSDHGPFGGGRPGAHVVDRHRLIRDGADGVHQSGQWQRGGNLVSNIARIVQIMAVGQHDLN